MKKITLIFLATCMLSTTEAKDKPRPLPESIEGKIVSLQINSTTYLVILHIEDKFGNKYFVPVIPDEVYVHRLIPEDKPIFVRIKKTGIHPNRYSVTEKAVLSHTQAPPCYIFRSDKKIIAYVDLK